MSAGSASVRGGGILGRVIAFLLAERGWRVRLFSECGATGEGSAAFVAGGLLCPFTEFEQPSIGRLGIESMKRWPEIVSQLPIPVVLRFDGTLAVAHGRDRAELERLVGQLLRHYPGTWEKLDRQALLALEPELNFEGAFFFPQEGYIDNRAILLALWEALQRRGVAIESTTADPPQADWIIDCRGARARGDTAGLRAVRGEILRVRAPEVTLTRPVRLEHPRYPVYLVPRPNHEYVVGATCVESEEEGAVTVRSTLELLSAAYSVHPAFAEATLLEARVGLRPAFPDNRPRVRWKPGRVQVNGLYRNGFLLSPLLGHVVAELMEQSRPPALTDLAIEALS